MVPPGSRPKRDFSTAGFRRATVLFLDESPGTITFAKAPSLLPIPTDPLNQHDLPSTSEIVRVVSQNRTRASNLCTQLKNGLLTLDCGLEMRWWKRKYKMLSGSSSSAGGESGPRIPSASAVNPRERLRSLGRHRHWRLGSDRPGTGNWQNALAPQKLGLPIRVAPIFRHLLWL